VKKEPYLFKEYHYAGFKGPSKVKIRRCQAVNRTDQRAGQQCHNAAKGRTRYCYVHRSLPKVHVPIRTWGKR